MGKHDHGHKPLYEVPSPDIYKVEDVPQLKAVQDKLAKLGLRDPWLRNEVWRFPKEPHGRELAKCFLRGYKLGIPAFLLTIGIESYFGIDYGHGASHGDHGNGAGHNEHAHH